MRAVAATLLAALLLPAQALAQAAGEPTETPPGVVVMGLDLVLTRPLGLCAVLVGAVLFVPTAIVTAPMGRDGLEEAWELLVTVPTSSVFQRPLGEF